MVPELNNKLTPYRYIDRDPIQYTYCCEYDHISRYKDLRQVVHQGMSLDRCITLETNNAFKSRASVTYYTVDSRHENRLDLIAQDTLGSATYSWVIAYFNNISDGYTALAGTKLAIPDSVFALFEAGECLASISAVKLNLGSE